jgi:hypothetical protein
MSGSDQALADPLEDKCIQALPLLGGCEGGISDRSGRALREPPALSWAVTRDYAGRELEVLGQIHSHQVGSEVEQERGVELATLDRGGAVEELTETVASSVRMALRASR